jgi:hypothetical protein
VKVLVPPEFENRLRRYLLERAEETRAVRAGVKSRSEQAAIVARYADLFTVEQLDALRDAWDSEAGKDAREALYRLLKTCEAGIVAAQLAPQQDALQNAELAATVQYDGETLSYRSASARVSTLPEYAEREELGRRVMDVSAELNEARRELKRAREELRGRLSGIVDPIRRSEAEKGVSLDAFAAAVRDASDRMTESYDRLRTRWLDTLLGAERASRPSSYHAPYVYRLSALADVYTRDRATEVCLATLRELGLDLEATSNVRLDFEDRPQKAPRPVVIPADPPTVVHLITRSLGGLQDYQSLLHEAGHALHFAGCDPELPYAFRKLTRDNALTEVYSYTLQALVREPDWHGHHFELSAEQAHANAEAARFLETFVFRRNVAKLHFELDFWSRFSEDGGTPDGYAENLTEATGFVYRPDRYLADMDADFYSADYLRAAIRSAQLRAHLRGRVGGDWWRRPETGDLLRSLFREGTKPSNEELAERVGYDPLDTGPLVAELTASSRG